MLAMHFSQFTAAVVLGWILSVCVHEFAHALVAYLGGDRSVRSKGYLSFNPMYYLHPVTSLLLPALILIMGGLPLPGGAVYVDQSSLRSRSWASAVSAAGPLSNLLLFALIAVVLHPGVGLVDPYEPSPPTWVRFLAVMALLQLFSVLFNLLPVPPLDGIGIIEPYLNYETRAKLRQPQVAWGCLLVLFLLFWYVPGVFKVFFAILASVIDRIGLDWSLLARSYDLAFFGTT